MPAWCRRSTPASARRSPLGTAARKTGAARTHPTRTRGNVRRVSALSVGRVVPLAAEHERMTEHRFEVLPLDLANSIDSDGMIEWRGRPKQLVVPPFGTLVLTAENEWVARDPDGNVVERE